MLGQPAGAVAGDRAGDRVVGGVRVHNEQHRGDHQRAVGPEDAGAAEDAAHEPVPLRDGHRQGAAVQNPEVHRLHVRRAPPVHAGRHPAARHAVPVPAPGHPLPLPLQGHPAPAHHHQQLPLQDPIRCGLHHKAAVLHPRPTHLPGIPELPEPLLHQVRPGRALHRAKPALPSGGLRKAVHPLQTP